MTEMSEVQLSRVLVKTDRAKYHITQVEKLAAEISPYSISFFRNSKGDLVGPEPSRTVDIQLIASAGDAIHNIRSALDHLAWQLAHWESQIPGPKCCFPIARTLKDYEAMKPRAVAGMSPEAKRAIDALRPYKDGCEPLWRIHHLDIIDKHRTLYVLPYKNLFHGTSVPGLHGTMTDQPTHFLGIHANDLDGKFDSPGQPTVIDLDASEMKPLIPTLHELLDFTEDLIKNFKPLLGQWLVKP